MKRLVTLAALALTACPPQLDPHGTICNVDPDCATGLVCIANICSDPVMGGGAGGGSAGGTGGGSAGGSGTGGAGPDAGGGGGESPVALQLTAISPTASDAGPCSAGDGYEMRRPDGGVAHCIDAFCFSDGVAVALPWQPSLLTMGQVVGEPLPDLVLVEGTRLHVLENLGGLKFAERPPAAPTQTVELGVNGQRISTACLSLPQTERTVFVLGNPVDGGTPAPDGGLTRDGGNGVLVKCKFDPSPSCAKIYDDVIDYTNDPVDDGGFDAVVISFSIGNMVFDSHLQQPYAALSFLPAYALGDIFFPPTQPVAYYSAFNGSTVQTYVTTDNDSEGNVTNFDISNVGLRLARLQDQQAVVAFYTGHTLADGFQLFDVDESGLLAPGEISPGTVQVQRVLAGDFSNDGGASRSAVLAVVPGYVKRWPIYSKSTTELGLQPVETLYSDNAADIALGDLDGDGSNELVIATTDAKLIVFKGR